MGGAFAVCGNRSVPHLNIPSVPDFEFTCRSLCMSKKKKIVIRDEGRQGKHTSR